MGEVVLLASATALNPTLLAVTTVMLLLPHPERLMLGYWAGGMLVSVSLGMAVVFALNDTGVVSTTKNTVSPLTDFVLAGIMFGCAALLARSRDRRGHSQQRRSHRGDQPPRWQQAIGKGTAKATFVIGALLSLPGFTYLACLDAVTKLHYPAVATVLVVIGVNLIQFLLIEAPILAFKIAPAKTPAAIEHAKDWGRAHGRTYGALGLVVLGLLLAVRGVVTIA